MKYWMIAVLLCVATIAVGASAQSPSPNRVSQVPPPSPAAVQKEGPFRLLTVARAHARQLRRQGFHADVVSESGLWWVVFYR